MLMAPSGPRKRRRSLIHDQPRRRELKDDQVDFSMWFMNQHKSSSRHGIRDDMKLQARERALSVFKGSVARHPELQTIKDEGKARRYLQGETVEIELTTSPVETTLDTDEIYGADGLIFNETMCPNVMGCHPIRKEV